VYIQCNVMKFIFGLNIFRKPGVCSLSQRPAVIMWPANMMATAPPSGAQVEVGGCRRGRGGEVRGRR
jgi:hypothetical protein